MVPHHRAVIFEFVMYGLRLCCFAYRSAEFSEGVHQGAAPVHVIHTGPGATAVQRGQHNYDTMAPYYEADIRPGQSLVMPGFTISVEAGRTPQQEPTAQPVVTVTPSLGGGHFKDVMDDLHVQQPQQQATPEHHPLAGVMRRGGPLDHPDQRHAQAVHRIADDIPFSTSQHPVSVDHYVPEARPQRVDMVDQHRQWMDSRDWGASGGHAAPARDTTFTEQTRPTIDNVQVSYFKF